MVRKNMVLVNRMTVVITDGLLLEAGVCIQGWGVLLMKATSHKRQPLCGARG